MDIQPADPTQADQLAEICIAAKAYWGYPPEWIARWRATLRITPASLQKSTAYVALADGELVGWYALVHGYRKSLLDDLWVLPPRIGTGVGRALFQHAVQQARLARSQFLEIEAEPRAAGFYERMGARYSHAVLTAMDREIPVYVLDLHSSAAPA
jgi:GNAT superfamily N-acetyltransferase